MKEKLMANKNTKGVLLFIGFMFFTLTIGSFLFSKFIFLLVSYSWVRTIFLIAIVALIVGCALYLVYRQVQKVFNVSIPFLHSSSRFAEETASLVFTKVKEFLRMLDRETTNAPSDETVKKHSK